MEVENDGLIEIVLKDGSCITYEGNEYTDYQYDRKFFIILYEKQWIGLFNLDEIKYVMIERAV